MHGMHGMMGMMPGMMGMHHGMMGMGMHHPMMGMGMGGYGHHGMGGMGMGVDDDGRVPLKVKSFMRSKKSKKKRKKRRKEERAVQRLIAQGRKDRLKAKLAKLNKRRLVQMEQEIQGQGQVQKCAVNGEARICVEYDELDGSVRVEYSAVRE